MKAFTLLLVLLNFLFTGNRLYGLSIGEVFAKGKEGTFMASSVVEFEPIKKTESIGGSGYNFERFLINQIQIEKGRPARIYYSNKDIMPPCIFTHVPNYPPPGDFFKIESLSLLLALLGQAHEVKSGFSYWSFFKISEGSIYLIHIRVSRGQGDKVGSMSIFESSKEYPKLTFNDFSGGSPEGR